MRRKPILGVALIVLVTVVLGNSDFAHAEKRYELVSALIKAQLLSDGGMVISERRTYRFVGSFTFAFRTLPVRPGVRYSEFAVREGDMIFVRDDSRAPGTFIVENNTDALVVNWYYRARNETRTFEFIYRVDGAIERYADAAVLYYQ
ncbi:DUF2207 domain-containing protein, partial [candidate division KSB1 bacterium]|nr:DUF2207 domain-containing protein [candidate division KSB1 bacterium]